MSSYWQQVPLRWNIVGPPLTPCREDLEFILHGAASADEPPLKVLVLGVTREYSTLEWPQRTILTAVDRSQLMIDNVWAGTPESAHCADWRAIPLPSGSQHAVICDGGLSFLEYPNGLEQLVKELHRVLLPGGVCTFRLYVPPANRETINDVAADLNAGRIQDLNHLKVRIWFALHESPIAGIRLRDVWAAVRDEKTDAREFALAIGWPVERVTAFDLYRDSEEVYRFPSVDQVRTEFCDRGLFALEAVKTPTYEFGESCPTVVLRRHGP